jgi:hypothetical protein
VNAAPAVAGAAPLSPACQHLVLVAALVAVAGHRPDRCHGFGADVDPAAFCQAVLHDVDPMVPLPAGALA